MLRKITRSSYLNLLSGLILILSAGIETIEGFGEGSIGAHHGILVFGLIQITKAIPEIMHGLKELEEAKELRAEN
ncbi:MAG: hypothetical protein KKG47_16800 [Proteobacteria bacterium]|nr:hypothetical protein [Pseudomonadota bacterium]MBU1736504.1 hypothetical protein [Pseudomonadota bacterium]